MNMACLDFFFELKSHDVPQVDLKFPSLLPFPDFSLLVRDSHKAPFPNKIFLFIILPFP